MTAEFERPPRNIDRYYESVGSGLGRIVGFIVVIALAALLFTTFYGVTPSGPTIVTSEPGVTAPDRTVPKVPSTPTPSTK
jgi:hypothetical protein